MKFFLFFVVGIPCVAGLLAFVSWLYMLLLGALHSTELSFIPPLGFWTSVLLVLFLTFTGGLFNSGGIYGKRSD